MISEEISLVFDALSTQEFCHPLSTVCLWEPAAHNAFSLGQHKGDCSGWHTLEDVLHKGRFFKFEKGFDEASTFFTKLL